MPSKRSSWPNQVVAIKDRRFIGNLAAQVPASSFSATGRIRRGELAEKFQDSVANVIDIFHRQITVNRKRKNLSHDFFRLRQARQVGTRLDDGWLLMVRHRIMNSGCDPFVLQEFRQYVPPLSPDDVHMINRAGPWPFRRNLHDALQAIVVPRRNVSPMLVQILDVTQLDPTDRRLNFVKTKIVTNEVVHVL